MAVTRYYSSLAQATTLAGGVSNVNTTIQVVATTGFPTSYPFTLALDYGASSEELVDVTSAAGTTLTVTRAVDGTSAQSHSIGAVVRHVISGRDLADSRTHEAATAAVHGVTGTVVGTSDTQTLTNKTLTSPTVNGGALSGTFTGSPTFSGAPLFTGGPIFQAAAAATTAVNARVSGDTNPRLTVGADGKLTWGSGAGAGDTTLYRSGADALATDDALTVAGLLTGSTGLTVNASAVDNIVLKASTNATAQIMFRLRSSTNASLLTVDDNGQLVVNSLTELTPAAWINYTPVWTASTTNPTLGNGTLTGRYRQVGSVINFKMALTFGTTTNVGSGTYSFTLPSTTNATGDATATGQVLGTSRVTAVAPLAASASTFQVFAPTSSATVALGALSNTGLFGSAWVSGHFIRISGTYEAA